MSKVTSYRCDFCKLPKEEPELIGFSVVEGKMDVEDIKKAPSHICFRCAQKLGRMADKKMQSKMTGSGFRSC